MFEPSEWPFNAKHTKHIQFKNCQGCIFSVVDLVLTMNETVKFDIVDI